MKLNTVIEGPLLGRSKECEPILRALPEWFGIETAIVDYLTEIDTSPTFLAVENRFLKGFLCIKQHNQFSAEILVMGVNPDSQRLGIGRLLADKAEEWLINIQVEYLQVKTLGPSDHDLYYAKTREFYSAMGFRPLEESAQIWGKENPCLIMIKHI